MTPDQVSVALRVLGLALLLQAVGAALFNLFVARQLQLDGAWLRRLTQWSAGAAIAVLAMHASMDAARMADDFAGMLDTSLLRLAWRSTSGLAHTVQLGGLLLIFAGAWIGGDTRHWHSAATARRQRGGARLAQAGVGVALLAFTLTGHTRTHEPRLLLALLLLAHLFIVAFWFGSLLPLIHCTRVESVARCADIVSRFSRLATWSVPCIALAGIALGWLLGQGVAVVNTPYGRLLLLKMLGFVALMLLATWNKWRLTPALRVGAASALRSLRHSATLELILILAVLAVTAWLTANYSPQATASMSGAPLPGA